MNNFALESHVAIVGEDRCVSVSYDGKLDAGELLTGTPTVTVSPTGPTISNIKVSTADLTISDKRVATGRAVQFFVTGLAEKAYTFTVTALSNSSPQQKLIGWMTLNGVTS